MPWWFCPLALHVGAMPPLVSHQTSLLILRKRCRPCCVSVALWHSRPTSTCLHDASMQKCLGTQLTQLCCSVLSFSKHFPLKELSLTVSLHCCHHFLPATVLSFSKHFPLQELSLTVSLHCCHHFLPAIGLLQHFKSKCHQLSRPFPSFLLKILNFIITHLFNLNSLHKM